MTMIQDTLPRDMNECMSCGLKHERVEARGVYFCPNPLCTVTGAAIYRTKLKSYVEHAYHHEVDSLEWLLYGLSNLAEDPTIRIATLRSAKKRLDEVIEDLTQASTEASSP